MGWGSIGSALGGLAGAALAIPTGGLSLAAIPAMAGGFGLGSMAGGAIGSLFDSGSGGSSSSSGSGYQMTSRSPAPRTPEAKEIWRDFMYRLYGSAFPAPETVTKSPIYSLVHSAGYRPTFMAQGSNLVSSTNYPFAPASEWSNYSTTPSPIWSLLGGNTNVNP